MQKITRVIFYQELEGVKYFFVQEADRSNRGYGLIWEFPGGKVEKNQTIVEGLLTEVVEETGVKLLDFYTLSEIKKFKKCSFKKQLIDLESGELKDDFHKIFVFLFKINSELKIILDSDNPKIEEDRLTGNTKWVDFEELIMLNKTTDDSLVSKLTLEDLRKILNER